MDGVEASTGAAPRSEARAEPAIAPTFRSARLQGELEDRGYVVVPFLTAEECSELRELCDRVLTTQDLPFGTTALQPDRRPLAWLLDELVGRFRPRVDDLLWPHEIPCAQFILKRHSFDGVAGEIELHQDMSFVDELAWRGMLMWCPLIDIAPDGGRLQVVPSSHAITRTPRGTGSMDWPFAEAEHELRNALVTLSVPAGHAVFYDSALVHASAPNTSGTDRPVVGLGLVPTGAEPVRFHAYDPGEAERFVVDPDYFMLEQLREPPTHPVRRSRIDMPAPVARADVAAALSASGSFAAEKPIPAGGDRPRRQAPRWRLLRRRRQRS